jgi:hypothetical protein
MPQEIAMAKSKKRVAARKKSSKRGKANTKSARKMAAKHATRKTTKSKTQRAGMRAKKPAPKKSQPPETVEARPVAAIPVKTAAMDMIEQSASGAVAVTERESSQMTTAISTDVELMRGEDISPAGTSP